MIPAGAQCDRCPHTVEDHDENGICVEWCSCTGFRWDGVE